MAATENKPLTADRVREVMSDCLFKDDEVSSDMLPAGAILIDGIVSRYGFHPERIANNRAAISEMLAELPDEFMRGKGGGWSFLQAAVDKHGNHWAEHPTMGALFALGQAAGFVKPLMPREMWPMLPGGMPYYSVDLGA